MSFWGVPHHWTKFRPNRWRTANTTPGSHWPYQKTTLKKFVTVQMNMWTSSKEVPQVWEKGREEKSRLAGDNLPGNRSAIKCKSPLLGPLRSAKEEDINAPRRLPLISDQRLGGNHGACTYQILEVWSAYLPIWKIQLLELNVQLAYFLLELPPKNH